MEGRVNIIDFVTRIAGVILIALSLIVSIPLTIMTYRDNGGPWGFGILGLPILVPLSLYFIFGITGLVRRDDYQRKLFMLTVGLTFLVGIVSLIILPVYPILFVLIPSVLSVLGMLSRTRYKYYLIVMIGLGMTANIVLLKWEIDFHRSLPIIQLFSSQAFTP